MGTEQHDTIPVVGEQATSLQNNVIQKEGDPITDGSIGDRNVDIESNGTIEQNEVVSNPNKMPYIYRQDVVRCDSTGRIGTVTEVAGDSDSESSTSSEDDDDDDEASEGEEGDSDCDGNASGNGDRNGASGNDKSSPLPPDQVRVLWIDDSEKTLNLNDVTVVDRGFLHGDYVASASDPTGQVGVVVDVNIYADLLAHDGSIIKDVSTKDVKRVRDFTTGDYVVLGPWLGRIDDVLDNVTVLFDDGSVCKVMKADPLHLKPVGKNILEDVNFPYYPGQHVRASSSSVFKNSKWLSGLWRANRLEGTVTKVTVGSVFIFWIASAGHGPDSSTAPAEEQSPRNLKLLSCFAHANWQLGDWCLLPSVLLSSSTPLDKGLPNIEFHDSDQNESDFAQLSLGDTSEMIASNESIGNDESTELDSDAAQNVTNRNIDINSSPESGSCNSSLTVSKEHVHETWPLHRKKIRKVVVRRDKKARKKEDNFERALQIVNSRTRVDVAWQDGTIECGLVSTTLIPIDSPGDHEFVAEQYVVEKGSDDSDDVCEVRRVGVVKSVNAKERTARLRWLKPVSRAEDPREFGEEEIVSVYELEGHPDYDYCYGDVVVRLSPVSVPTQTAYPPDSVEETKQETGPTGVKPEVKKLSGHNKYEDASSDEGCMGFSDLSWVGNITGLRNGDIEVTWADGMVSTVGPQAVYVVGRDDDESFAAGSEVSDDAASWETVDDDEVDTIENFKEFNDVQEPVLQNTININHESEESLEIEENNSGRNGALSIPLAALDFVARLASGIFSRGRKHLDPLPLDSRDANELQSQGLMIFSEKKASSDESSSQESNANDSNHAQNAQSQQEEHVTAEFTDLNVVAEALCSLRSVEQVIPACYEDDACSFKRFDIVRDPVDHHFIGANGQVPVDSLRNAIYQNLKTTKNNNGRKWLRKVQQDWSILQNNLPDGICVRVYEDRMDLLRAVIVGAYGTPYQDGLFFFDFHLPPEYPDVPPSAYYHSGGWRINPNLYEEGKVCLSLLNTWTGRGNEVWDPVSSSILQVLVSLQGLVLNSRPYFNEAGYDKQIGTAEGEKNSLSYNENTFLLNCKTMMFLMRRPPKDFEELVKEHFKSRGYYILKACDTYMKGYLIGSLRKDASVSDNSSANSTSVGFKLMLAKIVTKLFLGLTEVGANCDEFKHLHQS